MKQMESGTLQQCNSIVSNETTKLRDGNHDDDDCELHSRMTPLPPSTPIGGAGWRSASCDSTATKVCQDDEHDDEHEPPVVTYWSLVRDNANFRIYFISYLTNNLGEWFTYLASIAAIHEIQRRQAAAAAALQDEFLDSNFLVNGRQESDSDEGAISQLSIGWLIVVRLLPYVILCPFGGAVADRMDRKTCMIVLDGLGALVALLFVASIQYHSIPMTYVATFLQSVVGGLYEPSRSSILPLLTRNEQEMQTANNATGMAWSAMQAFGAALGGFFVSWLGIRSCYFIDMATYLLSALLMTMVPGSYTVVEEEDEICTSSSLQPIGTTVTPRTTTSLWSVVVQASSMITEGVQYLAHSFFGPLAFLKFTAALIYGAGDVLNVAFSERDFYNSNNSSVDDTDGGDGDTGRSLASTRLGMIFTCVGFGCFLGPVVSDSFAATVSDPRTLQVASLIGLTIVSMGMILNGVFASQFWMICLFSVFRAMGSSLVWMNSTVLLQKFVVPEMLGRVTAFELSAALLSESLAAVAAGAMQDRLGWSAEQVSGCMGTIGAVLAVGWWRYHVGGGGAAFYPSDKVVRLSSRSSSSLLLNKSSCTDTVYSSFDSSNVEEGGGGVVQEIKSDCQDDNDTPCDTERSPLIP